MDNRLSYFDLESIHHGDPINWHRDFSAGIDAPVILSMRTDYRDFKKYGDCKLVWEPNRHHQLVVLGRAYVATNERKYAEKIAELLRSWIDANPFGYGMNWKSPLELGIRLINWTWAIDLVGAADIFDAELWKDILQNVHWAMWDSERKFSRGSSANNHLIGEAAGVFVAASYFGDLPNAKRLRISSKQVLEREIIAQTYADGCTREHAFGYQFFVIQFLLACKRAGEEVGEPFSTSFGNRLLQMFRFLDEISRDTGRPPNMGDCDDGYVLDLGDLPCDASELLSVGGQEFDDSNLVSSSSSETVFWMYGDTAQAPSDRQSKHKCVSFPESGYSILRSGRMSVFFDCAELGYGPIAAHGHADCLSFCLSIDGCPVFVDPGTYDYFTHPAWRNSFRETAAHNTVEIDSRSQSKNLGPFMWGQRANAIHVRWNRNSDETIVSGKHDGYSNLDDPVLHQRTISVDHEREVLTIIDDITAESDHTAIAYFHLDRSCQATLERDGLIHIATPSGMLNFRCPNASISIARGDEESMCGWVSSGYHSRSPALCISIEKKFSNTTELRFQISAD